jgi:site-specific recombinase XerD
MASIYQRDGSGFYWVKYRDPLTDTVKRKSTGIRIDQPDGRRMAKRAANEYTQRELSAPKTKESERWETWADPYFAQRYRNLRTLSSAREALRDLMEYFKLKGIRTPAMVNYSNAAGFVPWRTDPKNPLGSVAVNTARLRFIYLQILMGEAVRRGYAAGNPCREVRHRRVAPKEKAEITMEHQKTIEGLLEKKPEWMREQWVVLMRQGCRVAETAPPLEQIDSANMTITLRVKGGRRHTQALHPDLLRLINRARAENRTSLIEGPPAGSWSAIWSKFFKRHNLPYSIHCTRVTVITRLIRAGHSAAMICGFIGHTEEVNRIYRRLKPPDAAGLLDTLASPASQARGNRKPRSGAHAAGLSKRVSK